MTSADAASPRVSIVMLTKNGARTLPAVMDMLAGQRIDLPVEVVALDSGSTDGTIDLLKPRVDQLVVIDPATFDHGLTRNAGVARARGEFVVLLVQDAVPASEDWLSELIAPLLDDSRVAGSFARQRPRDDAGAMTKYYLERWVAGSETPRVVEISDRAAFAALDPAAQFQVCVFDNVSSCIRKSVWEAHPFRATPIAEDIEWGRDVLLAGYRLAYAPGAVVVHSHDRPARYEFDRTRVLHRRLFELFRLRTIPSLPALARAIGSSLVLHWRCERTAPQSPRRSSGMARALALAFAWPLGQYFGARSAVRGWNASRRKLEV